MHTLDFTGAQVDGISPLNVYHSTFHNVPFVIFLIINSRLPQMALQMLIKAHDIFFKSWNRFSNSKFKSDIKAAAFGVTTDCNDNVGK